MAGIGFELKKLYKDQGLFQTLKAHLYSVFVTVGPLIISILAITILYRILRHTGMHREELELIQGTIMYSFVFSVILTSGYCMMLSRYLADQLYVGDTENILATFYGSISFVAVVLGIMGTLFYFRSPLDMAYRAAAYFLFVGLSAQMVISVFISAVKNFRRVAFAFLGGVGAALVSGYVMSQVTELQDTLVVILAFDICIFYVIMVLTDEVRKYFGVRKLRFFDFLRYFETTFVPLLVNTFYTLGLYIHNFVFWVFSDVRHWIGGTYVYAPYYDIPAGYAFLSIIPTLVIFVVKVETSFYTKYTNYYQMINNNASLEDIEISKKEMMTTIYRELLYIMEIQLFFSLGCIILGMLYLPRVGFSSSQIDMFSIMVLGYYCVIMSFVVMTLLLYFDNQMGAMKISLLFVIVNGIFSWASIQLGEVYYGTGILMAGLVTLIYALVSLRGFLREIDYYVFCVHVAWSEDEAGLVGRVINWLYQGDGR